MMRIGILAGGGRLPLMIAESALARGTQVHIVAIRGEADPEIERFPHTWVNWGQIGRMLATLRREGGNELVIAGGVRRPDFWHVRPDVGFFASLPQIIGLVAAGGDDSVLSRVVQFFEQQGLRVRGAHEIAPDLLAETGDLLDAELAPEDRRDAEIGFAVRRRLARLDAGQSVVVGNGCVLAIEGAEGTDRMLERVLGLPQRQETIRRGVLAKGPKPGQELRIDMPAIGPRTVDGVVAAGLAGIVIETGGVLVLDREETLRRAAANACVIHGLPSTDTARPNGPTPPLSARLIGRLRPSRRDRGDIERAMAVVTRLAAFATGEAAVVARSHVLAVQGAEETAAMLARVRDLRQWSDRRNRRRLGALAVRARPEEGRGARLLTLLQQAALQDLAAVAIAGEGSLLEAAKLAARAADDLGLCLVTCQIGWQEQGSGTA
jgi:DUF1009 family protein